VTTWDWLGEPLAVDFANTVKRRGAAHADLLLAGDDLRRWCALEGDRVRMPSAAEAAARLGDVRAVRDDVFAVLRAAAQSAAPPPGAAARLDARARRHPVIAQLAGPAIVGGTADAIDDLLARATADAIALAADAPARGLAFCDAPSCGQLFLRERGGQRWCGPACGTRARVARHAARHRSRRGPPGQTAP
jgi:predicted RNA-binding Zn ribbon-like protein